jgi:hypothetical protein
MADFIARVELHSAAYVDYESLHLYMQQRGYSRVIKGDDGKTYQLPTGTYTSVGSFASTSSALQSAVAAANATGKASSVIVADRISASWQGLPIASAARNS